LGVPFARRHRRLMLWLATLAVVFAALAPAVSHALALASGSKAWVEVCSAQGSRWVQLDDDGAEPGSSTDGPLSGHFDHCPFCHLGQQGLAPPPAPPALLAVPVLHDGLPERFFTAPRTAHAWCRAQPRAPPLFS
jgi:hypothetical protein